MHGKTSLVEHIDDEIFEGVANPMVATRYHSLAVEPDSEPDDLVVTAGTQGDHIVQGIKHRIKPMYAVQFHPELKSRPNRPHPLFRDFVGAAIKHQEQV